MLTDLHASTETENQVKSGFLLDVVIRKGAAVFELFSSKDQTLLIRWNTLLVLNLRLDVVDGIAGLDLEGDGLAGDCEGNLSVYGQVAVKIRLKAGVNLRVFTKICMMADNVDDDECREDETYEAEEGALLSLQRELIVVEVV